MPIYEYQCLECGEGFELLVGFNETKDHKTCPTCDSTHTTRLISVFASNGSNTTSSAGGCSSGSRYT